MKTTDRNRVYTAREPIDAYNESQSSIKNPIAMLAITRTITDHIPLAHGDESGTTLGWQIDVTLRKAARDGITIQTVAIEFERDKWHEYANAIRDLPDHD